MSETSPSDTSPGAFSLQPASLELLSRPPIKRARPQLSCTQCRQGKLKCNREHPVCDQCAKRSRHEDCQYMPPPARNKQAQNMRSRIRNLESLVVNLITQKSQEQDAIDATEPAEPQAPLKNVTAGQDVEKEPIAETFGQLRITNAGSQTSYVGAGHWSSILKEIEEVKDSLETEEGVSELQEEEWNHADARSTVTFGMPRPITKAQLIQAMPPKEVVDRLLPLWFNSADPLVFIVHRPTFQEEYKQFWKDSSATPVMWIALLYSVMALAIILGPRSPEINMQVAASDYPAGSPHATADYSQSLTEKFQQLASSALVLGDVAKSQPYTLETLMIYGECEFLRRDDHQSKVWLMNGVALRVALRMGYHRDPSNFTSISPFHGEMRRRVWHILNMLDTLISFAIGLPTLIRRVESDVRAPRNLYDSDIYLNMSETPKDRPDSEMTPALYTIAKSRVCAVFAEAAELSQKVTLPQHSTIMTLDARLEEAHNLIPEGLRVRSMEDSVIETPVLIMSRLNIELLYQKTRVVIHRNYLTAGQSNSRFADSRKICVEAALQILHHQKSISYACQPGGQLSKVWWYMSSLQTYDFLLAAMVICLELNHLRTVGDNLPRQADLLSILEEIHLIWSTSSNRYRESVRGAAMLQTMLKKCSVSSPSEVNSRDSLPSFSGNNNDKIHTGTTPELTFEEVSPQIYGAPGNVPLLEVPDIRSEIDWPLWDSTIQGQSHMLPQQDWAMNNATMESWIGPTAEFDSMLANNFHDFNDPMNIPPAPTFFTPNNYMDW